MTKPPKTLPDFSPRAPWWGSDLQTLRNSIVKVRNEIPAHCERLHLDLADGGGDRLAANLEIPDDPVKAPLVVLIHGLAGSENSPYMAASAAFHLRRHRRVLRLNLRGAGPSRASSGGHYHAGCGDDLQAALADLPRQHTSAGLFLIGYSLGGNILLNLLADHDLPINGAATISAPIEPKRASDRFMQPRNVLYHWWLLHSLKKDSIAPGARLTEADRRAIGRARSIFEFDDNFIAPRNGFAGADDYYRRTAGARVVPAIKVPTLLIHARNDPWIPVVSYEALIPRCPPNVRIVLTPGGGHVGFHAVGHWETWHDRAIDRVFG